MANFMNEFLTFFGAIFSAVVTLWEWLNNTTIGLIISFMVVISIFFWFVNAIIDFKN